MLQKDYVILVKFYLIVTLPATLFQVKLRLIKMIDKI